MNNKEQLIKCSKHVLSLAEEVYDELGSGFKEDTLQQALAIAFRTANIKYLRETHLEIFLGRKAWDFLDWISFYQPKKQRNGYSKIQLSSKQNLLRIYLMTLVYN